MVSYLVVKKGESPQDGRNRALPRVASAQATRAPPPTAVHSHPSLPPSPRLRRRSTPGKARAETAWISPQGGGEDLPHPRAGGSRPSSTVAARDLAWRRRGRLGSRDLRLGLRGYCGIAPRWAWVGLWSDGIVAGGAAEVYHGGALTGGGGSSLRAVLLPAVSRPDPVGDRPCAAASLRTAGHGPRLLGLADPAGCRRVAWGLLAWLE